MERIGILPLSMLLVVGTSSVLARPVSGREADVVRLSVGELTAGENVEFTPPTVPLRGARDDDRCTPGYDPCIPPGPDVDCAGGGGDGPRYIDGPVYVTGSDPYGLDRDRDGVGCG